MSIDWLKCVTLALSLYVSGKRLKVTIVHSSRETLAEDQSQCGLCFILRAAIEENAYNRMKKVVKWYISGFYKKPKVRRINTFYPLHKLHTVL